MGSKHAVFPGWKLRTPSSLRWFYVGGRLLCGRKLNDRCKGSDKRMFIFQRRHLILSY